jgi:uncharacterized RDD family membrane protein YckC
MASNGREDTAKTRSKYVWDPQKLAWVEIKESAPTKEAAAEPVKEEIEKEVKGEPAEEEAVREEEIAEEAVAAEPIPMEALPAIETLSYRGAWIRLLGFDIDFIIVFIIYFILVKALGVQITAEEIESTGGTLALGITIAVTFVYFFGFWAWRGQTIGKMIIGARIVRLDGSPAGFGYLVVISLCALYINIALALFLCLVVFLVIALNRKKRGIHDLVAGTCVINSRQKVFQPELYEPADTSEAVEISETPEPEVDKQG